MTLSSCRQSLLVKLFSVALFCSVFLQLAIVILLAFQEGSEVTNKLHLVESVSEHVLERRTNDSNESNATEQRHGFIPVKMDYDKAAPKVVKDSGRCHFLPSISHRQTSRNLVSNRTAFLASRTTLYEEGLVTGANDFRPLYMYNPSLLPLTHMDRALRDEITGRNVDKKQSGVEAKYLAIYRISTFANCFGPQGIGPPVHSRNYQGLALLDENLDIVPGTDIVVDISYWIRKQLHSEEQTWVGSFRVNSNEYHSPRQLFTDCRLAVMPAPIYRRRREKRLRSDPKNELFLTCDARMLPIAVHRTANDNNIPNENDLRRRGPNVGILPNEFGNGLRLSILNSESVMSHKGKNFNTFRVNETHYYMEYHPSSPHEAYPIRFIHRRGNFRPIDSLDIPPITSTGEEPNATWLEPETFRVYSFRERDRGGGCCVEIFHQNRSFFVGISHTRTIKRGMFFHHQYLSRLYAMEQSPPFNIVSKTGLFCLGYGTLQENRGNVQVGHNEKLLQIHKRGKKYHCPAISFVTGLSEHATNSSLAIISYGINDCYPRMIVVEKEELARMLFPGGRIAGT